MVADSGNLVAEPWCLIRVVWFGHWSLIRSSLYPNNVPRLLLTNPQEFNTAEALEMLTQPTVLPSWQLPQPMDIPRNFIWYAKYSASVDISTTPTTSSLLPKRFWSQMACHRRSCIRTSGISHISNTGDGPSAVGKIYGKWCQRSLGNGGTDLKSTHKLGCFEQTTSEVKLDDGWPESVEEQGLLLLVLRHYITRQYIKDVF